MQTHKRLWKVFQLRKASNFVVSFGIVALLMPLFIGYAQTTPVRKIDTRPSVGCTICSTSRSTDGTTMRYSAVPKGKLPGNASSNTTAHTAPAKDQPTSSDPVQSTPGVNPFPYSSCTWWADQRFHQLYGIYVPWHSQANAWEWTARAYQFGWHVSSTPVVGSIIDLQPGIQGAYRLGHVAIVEKILSNGHVITSNMSWGAYPWRVTDVEFTPDPGVTFIWK